MSNAEFSAPFTGNTALVLASKKSDGTAEQFTNDELFPISLSDASKGIKDAYNLASNPQYHNQYVYIIRYARHLISGIVGFYYGTKLIIEVKDYDWITP